MNKSSVFVIAVALLMVGFGRPNVVEPGAPELDLPPSAGPFGGEGTGPSSSEVATPMDPSLRAAVVRSLMAEASGDARYAFEREGGSMVAMHPSQDLRARFDAGELTLSDARGEHPIRVTLREVDGRPAGRASTHVDGNRVELRREALTEWYVHGALGLEQGFTLTRPTSSTADEVVLELTVEAPGYAVVQNESTIELSNDQRSVWVRDFYAQDATGRSLEARMSWRAGTLELRVNVEGARYPVLIDPMWLEDTNLVASDAEAEDQFGFSVAVSGDTAVVGAPRGGFYGKAYVFVRSGISWTEQAVLQPAAFDGSPGGEFGSSVSISGDTVVVGASSENGFGVGFDSGSAYVFVRSGTSWTQEAKLQASDEAAGDQFGHSVAVFGDTALVGALSDDDGGSSSGSAYVFVRSGTSWSEVVKLVASDAAGSDLFGSSVALFEDTALIGAPRDDDGGSSSGSTYVFVRSGTSWTEEAKLVASDATRDDQFGASVALSGGTAVIGAPFARFGSAYVFVRSGTSWTEEAQLVALDGVGGDEFGASVAVSGDTAVVGAPGDDDGGSASGSAYVFVRRGTSWAQQGKLVASDGSLGDEFGQSVGVSGDTVWVGARWDDDITVDSGSAYVFARTSVCGDGVLEADETCDDGNTANGDCCSSTCTFEASTVVCRASAGACDVAETCSGTSGMCPADGFAPSTTTCTGASNGGACDGSDRCSGTAGTCVDVFLPSDTTCRALGSACDVVETCSGTSGACPADVAPDCDAGTGPRLDSGAMGEDAGAMGEDAGPMPDAARSDAGGDAGGTTTAGGCSCAVPSRGIDGRGPVLLALSLLSLLATRRRRNRSASDASSALQSDKRGRTRRA